MQILEDKTHHPLVTGSPSGWASAWGHDRYGIWQAFNYKGVEQRLRWIPAGQFLMGSPENEVGRDPDERPHPITLTRGFWLFATPVTQALWQAVMGHNPSKYRSPARPVERVSWDDCGKFLEKLNRELPDLELRLPTEAQWEYACRAGTTTATYAGDLNIKGERDASILDSIAWYGGNSGVDYELENGWDSSDWPEKQVRHTKAGNHPVSLKKPNPWGLYDMLGNIYEWCDDWYGGYTEATAIDPVGLEMGDLRVIRGGSWRSVAGYVRAAYRCRGEPDGRNDSLGFRCARDQEK